MDEWLTRVRDALAAASGVRPDELDVDADTEATLLKLARIAAHESGARTNAPLLAYLVGVARRQGVSLELIAGAVREAAREPR